MLLKNGKEITIRKIVADDYDGAMDFLAQLSKETIFTNQYPGQPLKNKEKSIAKYEDINSFYLGAFDNDRLIGMASIHINAPTHPWCNRNCSFGVTILEAYYGQGLGTYFMEQLENWAKDHNMHRIEGLVRCKNRRALNLYIKFGYEIEGVQRDAAFINNEWHSNYYIGKLLQN